MLRFTQRSNVFVTKAFIQNLVDEFSFKTCDVKSNMYCTIPVNYTRNELF